MTWTTDAVWERVEEAMETIQSMPGDRPKGFTGSMPEHVRDTGDAWLSGGLDGDPLGLYRKESPKLTPSSVTRARVGRMDEVLCDWVWWLRADQRTVLLAMASGAPRQRITRRMKISRTQLYRLRDGALSCILRRLSISGTKCS